MTLRAGMYPGMVILFDDGTLNATLLIGPTRGVLITTIVYYWEPGSGSETSDSG
ncbi:MAG: hypothetical protein SCH39_07760 [Methanosarcinales archaeon]|nr:hypothetical protein [Methanosarcinales archaeon]